MSPRSPPGSSREEGDERLRDVREVGDHAVAGPDSHPLQTGSCARDLLAQLAERELAGLARLRVGDDRDGIEILVAADHVLCVVESRAREPLGAGHPIRPEHALVGCVRADLEEVPE